MLIRTVPICVQCIIFDDLVRNSKLLAAGAYVSCSVLLFPDLADFLVSVPLDRGVFLLLPLAAGRQRPAEYAHVDDRQHNQEHQNNDADADDDNLHCCQKCPEWNQLPLLLLFVGLCGSFCDVDKL